MNNLLHQQLNELLTTSASRATRACERALRVGAATLCRGLGDIIATTVVCNLLDESLDAARATVSDIADEYGLVATIQRQQPGSYSVRFSWPQANEPAQPLPRGKSAVEGCSGGNSTAYSERTDVLDGFTPATHAATQTWLAGASS